MQEKHNYLVVQVAQEEMVVVLTHLVVQVEVDNQNFNDATVYLQSGSGEQRLGIVRGKSVKTFVARLMGPYEVRLRVRLLAGGSFTTEAMHAAPGETLLLIVPSSLQL